VTSAFEKTPDIVSLAQKIAVFVDQLRRAENTFDGEEDVRLSEAFRLLHAEASLVARAVLAKALPKEDRGLFDVLFLGYESRAQRGDPTGFSSLVRLVRQYPDFQRAVALAEYLKTPEGHAFACLGHRVDDGKVARIFPDLSVDNFAGFINSIHAEQIGRFIGYVNAHRMDTDIEKYDQRRTKGQSLDAWLVEKMNEADLEFVVIHGKTMDASGYSDPANTQGQVTSGTAQSNKTRAQRRPDHFIMEFEAGDNSKIVALHYGNSTARRANVAMYQGQSAISNISALLNAVHAPGSPLYGAKVKPYYYLTGLFSVDAPLSRGQSFSSTLDDAGVERAQKIAIAQLPFLSMIACQEVGQAGTVSPHPDRTLALLAHNPFISGCDTLDLHGLALEIQDGIDLGLTPEVRAELDGRALNMLADKLVLAGNGLARALPEMFCNQLATGNFGESATALDAFLTTAQVFSRAVNFREEDLPRLAQVKKTVETLRDVASKSDHPSLRAYEDRFNIALFCLDGVKKAHPQNSLAGALSAYQDGMPKQVDCVAIPEDVQLRECLRQVADGLVKALPQYGKAAQVADILRAAHSAKEFCGVFDHRVRWRSWIDSIAKELVRKDAPEDIRAAFEVLRTHGFRGRVRDQDDQSFKAGLEQGRRDLLLGLSNNGFGYAASRRFNHGKTKAAT